MQPRVDIITLAVEDLHQAIRFYRALGWTSEGIVGTEFKGDDAKALARCPGLGDERSRLPTFSQQDRRVCGTVRVLRRSNG